MYFPSQLYWLIKVYNNLRRYYILYIPIKSLILITDGVMYCINILRSSIITPSTNVRKTNYSTAISESFIIVTAQRSTQWFSHRETTKTFSCHILFTFLFFYILCNLRFFSISFCRPTLIQL